MFYQNVLIMSKKVFKYIIITILIFILFSVLGLFGYNYYKKPSLSGEISIKNLDKTSKVYLDDYGIPHIYASTEKDAMLILGYVHAQDRLWQMELLRRIAPGKLSEIFGSKALENDKMFISLGINENSIKTVEQLEKNSTQYILAQAYLDGINQYMTSGKTPIEYDLLGIKKEHFTLVDVHNIIGYMAFSFAMAHKTDPLLTHIHQTLGSNYLKDFGLEGEFFETQIKNIKGKSDFYAEMSNQVAELVNHSPIPPFIGSNSWVIGAEKTKNGKVIFANDPHIAFSQPCTWYEAHIYTPQHEIYGYFLAGVPFPLLGHNRDYAYGLTMFENDDVDFFLEEVNPNDVESYKVKNGYKKFDNRTYEIKVKDSQNVKLNVKMTENGPIFNQSLKNLENTQPVAIYWEYIQGKNELLKALFSLSHAQNLKDFYQKVSLIHAPGLNVMYGDAKNNVAWITSGRLYQLHDSIQPYFINENHQNVIEKRSYLSYDKNPHGINPPWHYVYSANNQTEAIDNYLYPGYYLPQDRAKRITSFLDAKSDWTAKDVEKMILDHTSEIPSKLVKSWIKIIENEKFDMTENKALAILNQWKGSNSVNDIAPTVYNKWLFEYLKLTFEDELGQHFSNFIETHLMKQMFVNQSLNVNSPWWDNKKTANIVETQKDIMFKAFKNAISNLNSQLGNEINQWQWGKVHTLTHQHPIGSIDIMKNYFNVGPAPIDGTNEVINNMLFYLNENGNYEVKAGPSTRRIIDFSDVENSVSILPTGQSGVPSSPHYNDQFELYNQGKFRKMKMNKKEIIKTSTLIVFKKEK